jgi:hypothetical protein
MKQLKNEAEQKRKAAMQKELERQQAFLQVWSAPLIPSPAGWRGHDFQSRHTHACVSARTHTPQSLSL